MSGPAGASTCVVDRAFPPEAITYLNDLAAAQEANGETGAIQRTDHARAIDRHVRRSRISWLDDTPTNQPIYQLIGALAGRANQEVFKFELTGMEEPAQLATYRAEEEGHYGWHVDIGAGRLTRRKISLVIPLTDPSTYEGGEFEVFYDSEPTRLEMPLGRVVMFPSYLLHQVRPLTRGVRRSLSIWISGPPFR